MIVIAALALYFLYKCMTRSQENFTSEERLPCMKKYDEMTACNTADQWNDVWSSKHYADCGSMHLYE
jgi:hypothetical protein